MTAALLAAVLLGPASTALPDGSSVPAPWSLARAVDGVDVWRAERAGEFWGYARGMVDAPPDVVFARVTDFEALPGRYPWLDRVLVLARDDGMALVYYRYDLPWPLADRAVTARHSWWRDASGAIVLDVEGANALGPPPDGAVPIEDVYSRFVFTPAPGLGTVVEYLFRGDVAGLLPRAVRAQAAWKVPLNLVLSLRRAVADPASLPSK
jgi:hypothetical protein